MTSVSIDQYTGAPALSVPAPAKINLILRILDRRSDGFHNLWSIMQTVQLEDDVSLRLNPTHAEIALRCDSQTLSVDHTNLVYRAAAAVLQRIERKIGLDVVLTKRIPMGAGLGGGSSDAAATILGLNQLLQLGWSPKDMAEVGQALGSDIPFFFSAPSAVVSGRGEHVIPVEMRGTRWIVLVNPGFSVETKWAYRQLSETRSQVRPLSAVHRSLAGAQHLSWEEVETVAENDFEVPVFEAHPELRDIKVQLQQEGAELALLSGSGATVFGVFRDEQRARQAGALMSRLANGKVFIAATHRDPLLCRPAEGFG